MGEAFRATRADDALRARRVLHARSLAVDCSILEGLMRDVADKGCLAFIFSEGYLHRVIQGGGGLRSRFLGSHCGIGLSKHERWAPNVGTD